MKKFFPSAVEYVGGLSTVKKNQLKFPALKTWSKIDVIHYYVYSYY